MNFPVVGIGASAGGLEALKQLIEKIPPNLEIACVVILHLDPSHESFLANILSKHTEMGVIEAKDGMAIEARHIYTIAPNSSLVVVDGHLHTASRAETTGLFLPIDLLFHSLAENYQDRAVGIVLSGTGSDGTEGIQAIKANGGTTFAQDAQSAKFDGMPHTAIASGAVDFVLSPQEIAGQLAKFVDQKYWWDSDRVRPENFPPDTIKALFRIVQKAEGIDFSSYKSSTVNRRILRRMSVRRVGNLRDYLQLLRSDPMESKALCGDLLIQVTSFFRDPATFELLKTSIFPKLLRNRPEGEPIRVWSAGCSTGQELYSLLMVLVEYMTEKHLDFPIQFFGTDINEAAITKARAGVYSEAAVRDLGQERLRRFFKKEGKDYEFSKSLRESCIFAKHNLIRDPPFSRLDLLSCQNVLIYFDAGLQRRVLPIFHYALKPSGFLVLGPAETVGAAPELFSQVKAGSAIYSKSSSVSRLHFDFEGAQQAAFKLTPPQSTGVESNSISIGIQVQRETDRLCMAEFAPPGVVFNQRLEVIQFRGRTGPYFEHSPGFASFDLLRMLKEGLVSEVRAAIDAVNKKSERIRKESIRVRFNGDTHRVAIELYPVRIAASKERFFYLTFEDMDAPSYARANQRRKAKLAAEGNVSEAEQLSALRNELTSTKDYLQSINEQKEAANEELRAANEEIMSSNEELQSTNEELQTAKEELQSTNEELMTVNDELKIRNRELARLNDDQNNLFASLNVAVIMLSKDLRIRKFTPLAEKVLGLIPSDLGRPVNTVKMGVELGDLESQLVEVIQSVKVVELEVTTAAGQWYLVQIRPYRTSDDRIDGAVLLFSDITRIKCSLEYAEEIEETIGQPLLFLSPDLRVKKANDRFYDAFETGPEETIGKFIYDLDQLKLPSLKTRLQNILPGQSTIEDFEFPYDLPKVGKKTVRLKARRLRSHQPNVESILVVLELIPRRMP